ncbi:hypothetical protein ACODT3_41910 [Streptomyces sp. 4.24]|uniref:hypothetical protein n=1 Tax=Streptomyces tritrimontium TaxID=3406573 RepID=UPI003BB5D64A
MPGDQKYAIANPKRLKENLRSDSTPTPTYRAVEFDAYPQQSAVPSARKQSAAEEALQQSADERATVRLQQWGLSTNLASVPRAVLDQYCAAPPQVDPYVALAHGALPHQVSGLVSGIIGLPAAPIVLASDIVSLRKRWHAREEAVRSYEETTGQEFSPQRLPMTYAQTSLGAKSASLAEQVVRTATSGVSVAKGGLTLAENAVSGFHAPASALSGMSYFTGPAGVAAGAYHMGKSVNSLVRGSDVKARLRSWPRMPPYADTSEGKKYVERVEALSARRDKLRKEILGPRDAGDLACEWHAVSTQLAEAQKDLKSHVEPYQELRDQLADIHEYAMVQRSRRQAKRACQLSLDGSATAGGAIGIAAVAGAAIPVAGWAVGGAVATASMATGAYKASRSVYKRFQRTAQEPGDLSASARFWWALAIWRPVGTSTRQMFAARLYELATGPDGPVAETAEELVRALQLGPEDFAERVRLDGRVPDLGDEDWRSSLRAPEEKKAWIEALEKKLST